MNVLLRKNSSGALSVQCFLPAAKPGQTLLHETPVPAFFSSDPHCAELLRWLSATLQASQVELLAAASAEAKAGKRLGSG